MRTALEYVHDTPCLPSKAYAVDTEDTLFGPQWTYSAHFIALRRAYSPDWMGGMSFKLLSLINQTLFLRVHIVCQAPEASSARPCPNEEQILSVVFLLLPNVCNPLLDIT